MGNPSDPNICVPVRSDVFPLLMRVASTSVAIEWALAFLGCMRHLAQKPCIVLDIDGTILLNESNGSTKCVRHLTALADACVAHGIAIFCITARPDEEDNRAYTLRQLEKCRITKVEHVYMRPARAEYGSYKFNARQDVAAKGYKILLTIGDQFADIAAEDPPEEIRDDCTYIGQMSDNAQFGIKLPSEFA